MTPCSSLQDVARAAEHLLDHRLVEAVDEEREAPHAGALAPLQPAQQRPLARRLAQRGIHDLRRLLRPAHGEIHAGGEHRIEERKCIADQHPARPAHRRAVVGVVARDPHLVADELRILEALPQRRVLPQRLHQELHRAALALLQVVRPAHRADAHHPLRQRDHPHPAVREAVHADVAGVRPGTRRGAAEMPEDGGALVLGVLAAQLFLAGEEGVAPAGVDHVAGLELVVLPGIGAHLQPAVAAAALLDTHHLVPFAGVGAALAGVLEQHLVEVLAPDLVGVRRAVADGTLEGEQVVAALVVGLEIGAALEHPERVNLVAHAETLEHRQVHRQQRFADVKARMVLPSPARSPCSRAARAAPRPCCRPDRRR